MSMEPKTIGWAQVSIDAEGSITSARTYNVQVVGAGVGIYNVTIGGDGGVDSLLDQFHVVPQTGAVGGAGTARIPTVNDTSDTVKQVLFFDDAGVAADPSGFWLEVKRYPPLPTP